MIWQVSFSLKNNNINFRVSSDANLLSTLTHISLATDKKIPLANSEDPDYTPQKAASDQDLHYLHYIQIFISTKHSNKTNQTPLLLRMDRSKELE